MLAVFEEINGNYAVLLVEELSKTYHLHLSKIPAGVNPGDLFEVEINESNEIEIGKELKDEREQRREGNRMKRKTLKRRKIDPDKK